MADQGFPRGGTNSWILSVNLLFGKIFTENCMKMKEIGPGAEVPSPPPGSTANGMFKFPFYNSRFLRQKCSSVIAIDSDWLIDYLIVFSSCLLLMSYNLVRLVTARNEVGARLCFHRRVWFCSQRGVSASVHAGIPHSQEQTPPIREQTPPLGTATTPLGADTAPTSRHPPEQTPLLRSRHPPRADTTPGADPPPAQSMLGDTVNARAVRILLECNLV